jgi:lipopolysaccharide/colanic/teichoic acid biosynthesis glycosyltransferase
MNILYIGSSSEGIDFLSTNPEISLVVQQNALSAVQYLESGILPDAILCEIFITGGSGFKMFNFVRENLKLATIPFILLSFEFRKEHFKQSFDKKIDDFFVLPIESVDALLGRIRFLADYRKKYPDNKPADAEIIRPKMPWSKRIFDIAVASFALMFLSPVLLIVIIAIRLESKGKVFYASKRLGKKTFNFYKLRSMRKGSDAELANLAKEKNQYSPWQSQESIDYLKPCPKCMALPDGEFCSPVLHIGKYHICDYWYINQKKEINRSRSVFIKISNDPRITRVGKFIRNTSIDELPQLINVIKGDMSIVGNRPLPLYEAELLTINTISKRFLAPAGITGLWQVELRGKGGVMSEEERRRLDNEYADHFVGDSYSFWYDLKLILRTLPALFQKDTV